MTLIPGWRPCNEAHDRLLWACYRRARGELIKSGVLDLPVLTSRAAIAGFVRKHADRQPGYWYRSAEEAAACCDQLPGVWEPEAAEPTRTQPGTLERMQVYRQRLEQGRELFHPHDATAADVGTQA